MAAEDWLRSVGLIVVPHARFHYEDTLVKANSNGAAVDADNPFAENLPELGGNAEYQKYVNIFRNTVDGTKFGIHEFDDGSRMPFDLDLDIALRDNMERAIFVIAHEDYHYRTPTPDHISQEYRANYAGWRAVLLYRRAR